MSIESLNKTYSQVKIGGKVRIWNGKDFLNQRDFVALEAGNREWIEINGIKKLVADTQLWLQSTERNRYYNVVFYPGKVPDDTLNLWQGWTHEPIQGSYHLFKEHLNKNVCNGRKDHTEWLWQWMAQLIQHPEEKIGTCIVLRGGKGRGKTIFANMLGQLCQDNYIALADSSKITGRFNAMYENALLCCFEEAMWAGDKKGEGTLKNLITNTQLTIERKGMESYQAQNYTRFIVATNATLAVPASSDERRFFVLDVQDYWTDDKKQFAAMVAQMERSGYAGLMYDLVHTRLDPRIDLRQPPVTEALVDQSKLSEPAHIQFFRAFIENQDPEWDYQIWSKDLEKEMVEYCKDHRAYPPSWQSFLASLVKLGILYRNNRHVRNSIKREWKLTFDAKSLSTLQRSDSVVKEW